MPASPCDEARNVVVSDLSQQFVFAEKRDQIAELPLSTTRADMMSTNFLPVAPGDIVEAQRCRCGSDLSEMPLCLLALGAFYRFGFAPGRALGRSEKAMTSDLEVVAPERRALVFDD
jgi:hypothetical protein